MANWSSFTLSTEEIINRINELLQPVLWAEGVEVVETVLYRPRRGRSVLRLFLDHPRGGITLEEISRISRVVSELLDVHDLIPESYTLEVSSPGLTRELKKPEDYRRYAGRLVRITTRSPVAGRQVHQGVLQGLEEGMVSLLAGSDTTSIPLTDIARARLELDVKTEGKGDR